MEDRVRCREAGIPAEVSFATKGELAKRMLLRASAHGVPAQWVAGDTVYGYDDLRLFLEEQQKNYVVAVPETHPGWGQRRQQPGGLLRAPLPPGALWGRLRGASPKEPPAASMGLRAL